MAASHSIAQALIGFGARTDHRLMHRVNRWRPPKWMRLWMILATHGGDGWLWWAAGLMVALFGGRERFLALGAAALAAGVRIVLFRKLKRTIGPQASVCARTPLLGDAPASRPVFLSFRPHHYGFRGLGFPGRVLSCHAPWIVVLRRQRGRLAHPAGDALPQRRIGRGRHWVRPRGAFPSVVQRSLGLARIWGMPVRAQKERTLEKHEACRL